MRTHVFLTVPAGALLAAGLFAGGAPSTSEAGGADCQYGRFNGRISGVVEVCGDWYAGAQVTARIRTPVDALIGFCNDDGLCAARSPAFSFFPGKAVSCAAFEMGWPADQAAPTHAVITDLNFIETLSSADLTTEPPPTLKQLDRRSG
jgi:hypothetical protein